MTQTQQYGKVGAVTLYNPGDNIHAVPMQLEFSSPSLQNHPLPFKMIEMLLNAQPTSRL